jgi:ATP-dependent DNA helicase RecG
MSSQKEFKSISKRSTELLEKSEGYDHDFKESMAGVKADTLVAFANSAYGGTILVGVKEKNLPGGKQVGEVIGCTVSDNEKLRITNIANSCVPPVDIEVISENLNSADKKFYRIEIPLGKHKPYCSKGGTYKTREDGLSVGLTLYLYLW